MLFDNDGMNQKLSTPSTIFFSNYMGAGNRIYGENVLRFAITS